MTRTEAAMALAEAYCTWAEHENHFFTPGEVALVRHAQLAYRSADPDPPDEATALLREVTVYLYDRGLRDNDGLRAKIDAFLARRPQTPRAE